MENIFNIYLEASKFDLKCLTYSDRNQKVTVTKSKQHLHSKTNLTTKLINIANKGESSFHF